MTGTLWKWDGQTWHGHWCDDDVPTYPVRVPSEMIHTLEIVDDLGWHMPDRWADQALAGSDQMGHWNYGAKLGKIGGEPPVRGQLANEMTIKQAEEYAHEVGEQVQQRSIRLAAARGDIIGARKIGRDWLIPYEGFNQYLDHRPRPGRKTR